MLNRDEPDTGGAVKVRLRNGDTIPGTLYEVLLESPIGKLKVQAACWKCPCGRPLDTQKEPPEDMTGGYSIECPHCHSLFMVYTNTGRVMVIIELQRV